jgi:phage shock protein PspC (stress-responsive transcriptional regulator)
MTQTPGPSAPDQQQGATPGGPPPLADQPSFRGFEQLRRSTTDRKVAGVAGGLGRHLNIDPVILRVLFVVMCFFGGSGFLLYGAAWALVPEDGKQQGTIAMRPSTRNALLIGAGVVAVLLLVGDSYGGIGFPWPLLVVGVGALVYIAVRDKRQTPSPWQHPATYAGQDPAPPYDAAPPSYDQSGAAYATPGTIEETGAAYGQTPPPWLPPTPVPPAVPPRRPRHGPRLFGPTLALVALALGSLGLYDASGGHVVDPAYPALALAVVGVMLVVGAFIGRAGGLILLGVVAAVALGVTSLVGNLGGWSDGQRLNATPLSASAVKDSYFVPNGRVVLDLSDVRDPAALAGRSVEVGARAGEVVVVLPQGVTSDVDADISGPGQVDMPDRAASGFDNQISESFASGAGTLTLRVHLFAGHIDVRTS